MYLGYVSIAIFIIIIITMFLILIYRPINRRYFNLVNKLPHYSLIRLAFDFIKDIFKTFDAFQTMFNVPHAIAKKYEKDGLFAITIWPFAKTFIFISSPDCYRDVLSDEDNLDKHSGYSMLNMLMGKRNLISSEGAKWKRDRPIIDSTFTDSKLASLNQIISEKVDILIDTIKRSDSKIADMQKIITALLTHIMIESTIAKRIESDDINLMDYIETQRRYLDSFVIRAIIPVFMIFPSIYFYTIGLPLTLKIRKIRNFLEASIYERIDKIKNNNDADICLSDSMIKAHLIDATIMPMDAIINHIITFFVTTTTATPPTLNAILFLMASHPDIQKKLQNEVDANFDIKNIDGQLSNFDIVNKLTYLDAVVKEGLRIYPISASIGRKITKETNISGYDIPIGCEVIFDFTSLFKHPDAFPYQPNEFIPERFIPEHEAYDTNRHKYAFNPFASGHRTCLGNKLSINLVKIFLIKILLKYNISTTKTKDDIKFAQDVVVFIRTLIDIEFHER